MATSRCPRCGNLIDTATADSGGVLSCGGCGAKLRSKPTAPADTRPPAPDPLTAVADAPRPDPKATIPPGGRRVVASSDAAGVPAEGATLESVYAELLIVRRLQEQILDRLRGGTALESSPGTGDVTPVARAAVRSSRRKTVLVVIEDEPLRDTVVTALARAQIPTRSASSGNEGLAEVAREKPDVLVIDFDMRGSMGGKDVVDLVKATMEWVDIPIILYGSAELAGTDPQMQGADVIVAKGPGSAATMVETVVAAFRRP